jgi:ATP phosphoribosyltransferase
MDNKKIILALPKGRILKELLPLLEKVGIVPEDAFFDSSSRLLRFKTNHDYLDIIRVRSFDVATFVAFGGAALGITGRDVTMEFDNDNIYTPLDLGIGKCRLSIAEPAEMAQNDDLMQYSHLRVATKYPAITKKYFAERGIQAECVKLNGAMELAPTLGLCSHIVDLVSTGTTLRENGLVEVDTICEISSQLIVNRIALKTKSKIMNDLIEKFRKAVSGTDIK